MRITFGRVVLLQWGIAIGVCLLIALWGLIVGKGLAVAVSFLFGAGCSLIPNSLLALRIWVDKIQRRIPNPVFFFVAEFLKIGMTLLLMVIVVRLYHDLVWLPFLLGLIVVLMSYLLTLFWLK